MALCRLQTYGQYRILNSTHFFQRRAKLPVKKANDRKKTVPKRTVFFLRIKNAVDRGGFNSSTFQQLIVSEIQGKASEM